LGRQWCWRSPRDLFWGVWARDTTRWARSAQILEQAKSTFSKNPNSSCSSRTHGSDTRACTCAPRVRRRSWGRCGTVRRRNAAARQRARRREGAGARPSRRLCYFAGVGVAVTGAAVGASSRSTIPAGVRRDSIGVVSGVGGAGAGVAFSAAWRPSFAWFPQPAAARAKAPRSAARGRFRLTITSESRRILSANDKYCRSRDWTMPAVGGRGAANCENPRKS